MSHTTETLHVRGVLRARVLEAIVSRMRSFGFAPIEGKDRVRVERTEPSLRRLALRRDKKWLTFADSGGYDSRYPTTESPDANIDAWGEYLSRALDRSVLAIWTWDGEAAVRATRWKRGRSRGVVSLLDEAYRGSDGLPYAPAKIFWPWLPLDRREAILKSGIKLVTPSGGSTGDSELDELLEGFDDADRAESPSEEDGEEVFVSEDVSVVALGAAVGISRPFLNPWTPEDRDEQLLFLPHGSRPS